MSLSLRLPVMPVRIMGPLALAALMGTTMLVLPLSAARADGVAIPLMQLAQASTAQKSPAAVSPTPKVSTAAAKVETVEERIANLRTALQITAGEEPQWLKVAQVMRENAAAMEKLVADKSAKDVQNMTAVDDLKTYETFAQAHVAGLKNLTAAFEALYNKMPEPQKKIADQVFDNAHGAGQPAHS
jgi:hypothetical protein